MKLSDSLPTEHHFIHRVGWLRAAVLGSNDGIVSLASLLIGMAAASSSSGVLLITGAAGLVAGAMSMAAGEYVSVSSQADIERADLETERQALIDHPEAELRELAAIYQDRGLDEQLAFVVARKLTEHDQLGAHARDELGMTEVVSARPVQAAFVSGLSFSIGASLPLFAAIAAPANSETLTIAVVALLALTLLGVLSAVAGGASIFRAVVRVVFWGAAAMILTGAVGSLFGSWV
jgi:VIT1/CCC1 family predicted Fe2+/Mn2+ transporter